MWLLVRPVGSALFVLGRHSTRSKALNAARALEIGSEVYGVVPSTIGMDHILTPQYLFIDETYKGDARLTEQWQLSALSLSLGET